MERKIGEIFEYNGEWYQCINKGFSCADCDLKGDCLSTYIGDCSFRLRKDGEQVRFKKLEKVGEPVTVKGRTFQKFTSDNNSCKECVFNVPNKACCKNSYIEGICDDNGFWVEIKQNQEDMKENNDGNTPLNELTDKYVNGNINYDEFEKEVKALYSCKKEDMEENKVQHYDCFFDKEQSKSNLKPFDLEAAKAGKPVCTRDGRKARIICFDRKDNTPIVALIECVNHAEILQCVHNDGKCSHYDTSDNDLMMLPEKHEGWMNVYRVAGNYESGKIYQTKKDAINGSDSAAYVATVKIEWEE